jgi:ubiquinone/menaquinone biosynthesis C-methylase UbiE
MNKPLQSLETTQASILKHHGGDGSVARQRITEHYERRHDADFWMFWNDKVAVNHQSGDIIMDLGAGIGQFVQDCALRYADAHVIGIEVAPYMLHQPLALPSKAQIVMDDLNAPQADIPPNSVSMVMANMLVHELTQPMKMFQAVRRWIKVGGRFCVIDVVRQPLQDYLQRRYPNTEMWQDSTSRSELEDAFEHFLEHNRYHPEDIVFMLESGGFKLISREPLRNGGQTRIVVEKV